MPGLIVPLAKQKFDNPNIQWLYDVLMNPESIADLGMPIGAVGRASKFIPKPKGRSSIQDILGKLVERRIENTDSYNFLNKLAYPKAEEVSGIELMMQTIGDKLYDTILSNPRNPVEAVKKFQYPDMPKLSLKDKAALWEYINSMVGTFQSFQELTEWSKKILGKPKPLKLPSGVK